MTSSTAASREPAERPLRADARRNRERLLAAAREVFVARGTDTSLDEIARAAGVGPGTLYRHFPRRVDLVDALYREDVQALVDLADRLETEREPWDALVAFLEGYVDYVHAKRVLLDELQEAFRRDPDLKVVSRGATIEAIGRVLARAQEAGVARADLDASDLQQLVGGMCMSQGGSREQHRRLVHLLLDAVRLAG